MKLGPINGQFWAYYGSLHTAEFCACDHHSKCAYVQPLSFARINPLQREPDDDVTGIENLQKNFTDSPNYAF